MRRLTQLALESLEDRTVPSTMSLIDNTLVGPQPQPPAPTTETVLIPTEVVLTELDAQSNLPAVQLPAVQDKELYTILFPVFNEGDSAIGQVFANPDDPIEAVVEDQANLPAVQLPAVQDEAIAMILFPVFDQGDSVISQVNAKDSATVTDSYNLGQIAIGGDTYANPDDPFLANPDDPFLANPDDPFWSSPANPLLTQLTVDALKVIEG